MHFRSVSNVAGEAPSGALLPSRVEPKFSFGFFNRLSLFIVRSHLLDGLLDGLIAIPSRVATTHAGLAHCFGTLTQAVLRV